MSEANLKKKTVSGLLWRFAERCGAQLVAFVVSIVLARLLSPDDYGLIAMITVFITISQVFVDSGMANALIQKKNADNLDFSSVFYFNVVLCLVIYIILFITAPFIAGFYGKNELTPLLRVLGITIIISGLKNVQQAYVSKKMLFKKFFFATLGGTLIAATAGIALAYMGAGAWALVVQQILNVTIDTIILWFTVKWRPQRVFSLSRLKGLFSYGWKLLVSALIDTFYNNLRQLLIGKIYSSADLAYYNRGQQFPNFIVSNINASIDSVLLSALSSEQDHIQKVKTMTRRAIKTSSFIMWPMMIGLAVLSKPLIIILLTDKWLAAVPFLQIFCINYGFQPIQTANLNAIKALGRSDLFLKLEITKKAIGIVILIVSMRFSVLAVAVGLLLYTIIVSFINSLPNAKLLGYSYFEQIRDMAPALLLSCIMGMVIFPIKYFISSNLILMTVQIFIGGIIYIGLSSILRLESFTYIIETIKSLTKHRRKCE